MTRGTSPTFVFTKIVDPDGEEVDLSKIVKGYATFEQMGVSEINKELNIDTENNKISVSLTREETLSFIEKRLLRVQLSGEFEDGTNFVTDMKTDEVYKALYEGVI